MAAEPEPKMLTARDLVEHLIPAKSMVDGWYVATKGCPHCHSKPFRYKDRRNGMRGDVRFVCPGGCTPALLAPDLGVSVRALVGHQLVAIDGEILPAEMTSNPVNGHQPAEPSATETAVAPASAAPPVATPSTPSPAAPSVARHPVIEALLDEMVGAQDPWLFVNTIDLDENHIEMGYRRVYFDNFVAMLVPLRPHEQDPLVKRGSQVFGVRPDKICASIQALRRAETVVTQAPATERQLQNLQLACESVLTADDPLTMVAEELVRLGCGGDSKIPLLIYLAGTTRLLLKVRGAPPCHLQLNGPAGTGKSYICDAVLSLFPAASLLRYDATSPRVMLYDEVPIKHKIL